MRKKTSTKSTKSAKNTKDANTPADSTKSAKSSKAKPRKVETVEERRAKVLARGRKFKYPLQHAKYKVMIYTIIIAVLAVVGLIVAGWTMLYRVQDTGDVVYRITTVLPLPVAAVDGENVRYSDYLMIYRSSITTVEQQSGQLGSDEDAQALRENYKRSALDSAEEYTYAIKLADQLSLTVSDEEVQESVQAHLQIGGTEQTENGFFQIIQDNFGLSRQEYERMLYLSLLKEKVSIAVDDTASQLADQAERLITEKEGNLAAVAEALGDQVEYEETGGLVDNKNIDGGRSTTATQLNAGEISPKFVSSNGDGYYFVKLIEKTDNQINYASIKIPFTTFSEQLQQLRDSGQVQEYITVASE